MLVSMLGAEEGKPPTHSHGLYLPETSNDDGKFMSSSSSDQFGMSFTYHLFTPNIVNPVFTMQIVKH